MSEPNIVTYESLFNGKYAKTIDIQELEYKEYNNYYKSDKDTYITKWLNRTNSKSYTSYNFYSTNTNTKKNTENDVLFSDKNITANNFPSVDPFFMCFYDAYLNHKDIIMSPDDIMIMVGLQFSKYVNSDSEGLRSLFVNHEGKKDIEVVLETMNWGLFTELVINQVKTYMKDDVIDNLSCDFSSTTRVERFMSNICVMDSFKEYFRYGLRGGCGIAKVYMIGNLDDWTKLRDKINNLRKYAGGKNKLLWSSYVDNLIPVIDKLIDTYNGKIDKEWWNKIVDFYNPQDYVSTPRPVSGWILAFYYNVSKTMYDLKDIPSDCTKVPVSVEFRDENKTKIQVNIYAGFSGFANIDDVFRPQSSFAIIVDSEKEFDRKLLDKF